MRKLTFHTSFDVDLPKEVDDEYWENEHEPEQAFKQPAGKPSLLSYFVSLIKLIQILAIVLRTIVSPTHIISCSVMALKNLL